MNDKLAALRSCVEVGKAARHSPYPPELIGQPGALEWVQELLADGVSADAILNEALIPGLLEVGRRYQCNEAYVPDMLISADAMKKGLTLLRGQILRHPAPPRGTFIVGTVAGDVHDIGKNLVAMMAEGAGWHVVDLGVDVAPERFIEALDAHPDAVVGLSALLTTTMTAMKSTIDAIHRRYPQVAVIVGGAPVTEDYARAINAAAYAADPAGAVERLGQLCAA